MAVEAVALDLPAYVATFFGSGEGVGPQWNAIRCEGFGHLNELVPIGRIS